MKRARIIEEIQHFDEDSSQERSVLQTPEEWDEWARRQHEAEARIREQLIAEGWRKAGPGKREAQLRPKQVKPTTGCGRIIRIGETILLVPGKPERRERGEPRGTCTDEAEAPAGTDPVEIEETCTIYHRDEIVARFSRTYKG